MANPLAQFEIKTIVPFELAGYDVSFTNSSAWMIAGFVATVLLFTLPMRKKAMVPSRWQSISEMMYEMVANMVRDNMGKEGKKYFPLVFMIFMVVLMGNLLGLIPYSFTYTSHIIVTFALAMMVFLLSAVVGFWKHGLHFLAHFFPPGVPLYLAPVIIPIEIISFLSRPLSLSVRLFINMMAGHTILKVFAGFSVSMGVIFGLLPLAVNTALMGLELLVAFIQAYVFAVLTCIYIQDCSEMH